MPDDHTLLLSLKLDEYPGCSLGGFASVTKNPKVLFFAEPCPGRTAPASATVKLPPIASADEDVVHEVVRAGLKRQGGAVFAIRGDRNANEESALGGLGEHRLLEDDTLIHTLSVVALARPLFGPGGLRPERCRFRREVTLLDRSAEALSAGARDTLWHMNPGFSAITGGRVMDA